jgi:hypothetical protein
VAPRRELRVEAAAAGQLIGRREHVLCIAGRVTLLKEQHVLGASATGPGGGLAWG